MVALQGARLGGVDLFALDGLVLGRSPSLPELRLILVAHALVALELLIVLPQLGHHLLGCTAPAVEDLVALRGLLDLLLPGFQLAAHGLDLAPGLFRLKQDLPKRRAPVIELLQGLLCVAVQEEVPHISRHV
eukprot:11568838-Alexandrium_andersonii.AAC.1